MGAGLDRSRRSAAPAALLRCPPFSDANLVYAVLIKLVLSAGPISALHECLNEWRASSSSNGRKAASSQLARFTDHARSKRRAGSSSVDYEAMPFMSDPATLSGSELLAAYKARALSPVEVINASFARIDRFQPEVNAFTVQDRDGALKTAGESERRWFLGNPLGPCDGIPATIKDNIAWAGFASRSGSSITSPDPLEFDAPAVARLKEAGCIILGKTTMPEFAWKATGDSPLTGVTRNPWKLSRTSGGSSSGAGVAAALGLGVFHLGTDGGGSIRIPASFNGVVGFKPSYGRVPAFPSSPMGGLAHLGPLTRSVSDAARMLSIIGQPDSRDLTAWNTPMPDCGERRFGGLQGKRIGWSSTLGFAKRVDPEVARITEVAALTFANLGATVDEVEPDFSDPIDVFQTLWTAGAALTMRAYPSAAWTKCDPGLVHAAEAGAGVSGADVIEALTRTRYALSNQLNELFSKYDLLLSPQTAVPAIPVGLNVPPAGFAGFDDWGSSWTEWSPFTYLFNITQSPALSLPCGFTADGLPVGLQIVGPLGSDEIVLRTAHAFEAHRPFKRLDALVHETQRDHAPT